MKLATSPALDITLCVNGVDLPEYDDNNNVTQEDSLKQAKYVEVVPGANFTVRCALLFPELGGHEDDSIRIDIYLDGKLTVSRVLPARRGMLPDRQWWDVAGAEREMDGAVVLQRFNFATLQTVDSDDGTSQHLKASDFTHLGEVGVSCTFVRATERRGLEVMRDSFKPVSANPIPEKCLKGRAISHRVS